MRTDILDALDIMIPNVICELNYNHDYELLIATVLSAQSTDKRVNMVTPLLWERFDLSSLAKADIEEIAEIIKPVGTNHVKAKYLKGIATRLIKDYDGQVPNNREYLESLPGVGHKTANVVLSHLFQVPAIAVDTHVTRVSIRLGLAKKEDHVIIIEKKLMKCFPKEKWGRAHLQLVLFGRYICTAKKPHCEDCMLKEKCRFYKGE